MDLKSGNLYWKLQKSERHAQLRRSLKCDIAILGSGLTGALCAYQLIHAGFDVVLVDKRDVARGSTSASTALILYEIDVSLRDLIRKRGKQKAERSYQLCYEAIDQIEQIVGELGDDCGFSRKKSLYLASSKADATSLKSECRARQRMGLNVDYVSEEQLEERFHVAGRGAILSCDAAQINPVRFTQKLVEKAVARGLKVFGNTEISSIDCHQRKVVLRTNSDHTMIARKAILAAGYESRPFILPNLVRLRSTYAIAAKPMRKSMTPHFLLWETARPYAYLRSSDEGRILIGGEDEDFQDPDKRDRLIGQKTRRLERRLRELIPGIQFRTEKAWAGTFGDTKDGLPFIGTKRGAPNLIYALCYGANGTNFAMIAANLIRDRLDGRRNPDQALFSLYR